MFLFLQLRQTQRWIRRYHEEEEVALQTKARTGRKRILSQMQVNGIIQSYENQPFGSTVELCHRLQLPCSTITIQRRLKENGFFCRTPAKKAKLTVEHRRARVQFAMQNLNRNWENVIFVDEKVFKSSYQKKLPLWRRNGTRYEPRNVVQMQYSGRITAGYFGFMSSFGPGELIRVSPHMNAEEYTGVLDLTNRAILNVYGPDLQEPIVFVQDNSGVHNSHLVRRWFEDHPQFERLPWPAMLPDLNPIENLWALMMDTWNDVADHLNIRTREGLHEHLMTMWERQRGRDLCSNLVASMPRRMAAVIESEGYWINY